MATRTSMDFSGGTSSHRGKAMYGGLDYNMFPEKYEETPGIDWENSVENMHRNTLVDRRPDNATFAYEQPIRNKESMGRINLRYGGYRTTTEPWQNPDFDTQFHDKDPRGYSTEIPWKEFRRNAEAHLAHTDYRDDGDYSITGGGINPDALYYNIRQGHNWVKARLKIFSTALENRHVGGVGVYDNVSKVYKSEHEDTSVMVDGTGMSRTFEDPEIRARATRWLSNWVHGGSKALRANTTTDHKVKVAQYGKLLRNRGLIDHETQMRLITNDTKWLKAKTNKPVNLVKYMSSVVQDSTADAMLRRLKKENMTSEKDNARYSGMKYSELEQGNHNKTLVRDIMALMGVVENDVKFLESQANKNVKSAEHALANLFEMVQMVEKLPPHAKINLRDELITRSGLLPGDNSVARSSVINPKILRIMQKTVSNRKNKDGDAGPNRDADTSQRLKKALSENSMFITHNALRDSEDISANLRQSETVQKMREGKKVVNLQSKLPDKPTHAKGEINEMMKTLQSKKSIHNKMRDQNMDDFYIAQEKAKQNVDWGDNEVKTRLRAPLGNRRAGVGQRQDFEFSNETETSIRKN